MHSKLKLSTVLLSGAAFASALYGQSGDMPSAEEMWKIIQQQQKQIEALQAKLDENSAADASTKSDVAKTQSDLKETREQLDMTADAVDRSLTPGVETEGKGWSQRTTIGAYGELHANFYSNAQNSIDFHRFVLMVNHDFNENIHLFTEVELEHALAGSGKPGEVELEQAFVEFDIGDQAYADVGLFLMPVVGLNLYHEPTTFYGVERNGVDSRIIPTTWWEAGGQGGYRFDNGISLVGSVTSGLDVNPATGNIRSGRQKVANAAFDDVAFAGMVTYTGTPGLNLGASVFVQDDMAQTYNGRLSGVLTGLYGSYTWEGFTIKGEYARWDLWGNSALPSTAKEQWGTYIEPSYRFKIDDTFGDLGFFYRFSYYEYQSNATFFSKNTVQSVGFNYWPIDDVVLKAEYQYTGEADDFAGDNVISLGFGFVF
ncbi:hypothetical protein [Cerasicoccus maritimus]|uniref:hypothetical protein n=1 Tax=Cerasicoccus maritimus TaxID=490089 RepID=UPI002852B988|nr:hypothetical protein [Cerasicoccus maritimus]